MENNEKNNSNLEKILKSRRELIFKEDDDYYESIDTSLYSMSPSFERRMRKKIRRLVSGDHPPVWTRFEKVAAVIVAVTTALFISAMSVEAIRETVWGVIVEWFEISYSVTYDEGKKDATRIIEEKREPSYLPEEYEMTIVQDTPYTYYLKYSLNGERVLTYRQAAVQGSQQLDGDDCTSSYVYIGEYEGFMVEYFDGGIAIVWSDNENFYTIHGYSAVITSDEIIKIAESIK